MIGINGVKIERKHFPDGTQMLLDVQMERIVSNMVDVGTIDITWNYEDDEELVTLYFLVSHIREKIAGARFRLRMDYIPNARMDRTKSDKEVFTLKYFCKFINSLGFEEVLVLDPHSNVSVGLLDNVRVLSPENIIWDVLNDIEGTYAGVGNKYKGKTIIYFPDEGAMKRYHDMDIFTGRRMIYGRKKRDWATGKILGLDIFNEDGTPLQEHALDEEIILMIDDIISYGGTLAYSVDKLKELGSSAIYAFASHTENSVLDAEKGTLLKRIENGTLDELYTTRSIYSGDNPHIGIAQINFIYG